MTVAQSVAPSTAPSVSEEEIRITREDKYTTPGEQENTHFPEERRSYKQSTTHIDIKLPSVHRHTKTASEAPRRRTYRDYHETQIDVAEREYRTRYQPNNRDDTRFSTPVKESHVSHPTGVVETNHSDPHFQPTNLPQPIYREDIRLATPSEDHTPKERERKVRNKTFVKESSHQILEKVQSPPKETSKGLHSNKMGYYDDGHCESGGSAEPAFTHNTVTIPCHHIRVGDLLILQGRPCQVIRISTSAATGQHRYLGVDLFTKQLHEESSFISNPSPSVVVQTMLGPVFKQYRVLDLQDGHVVAMTETGDVKQSIPVIDQSDLWGRLSKAFKAGSGSVRVLVISDSGRELAVDMKVIHSSRL